MVKLEEERYEDYILSSPANITGICQSDDLLVNHMFHGGSGILTDRNYYVIRIKNSGELDQVYGGGDPELALMGMYRNFAFHAQDLCTIFSLCFGKRFEYHGLLRDGHNYQLPRFSTESIQYRSLPIHNHQERVDKVIDMNRTAINLFLEGLEGKDTEKFINASRYYAKALINISYDIEVAYIDLVRSIEILANDEPTEELNFIGTLGEIYEKIKDELKLATFFRKYHGSSKKFSQTILGLVGDDLRERKEAIRDNFSLQHIKPEEREALLKTSYTIRNNYIHSGLEFGHYVLPDKEGLNEILHGSPGVQTELNRCLESQKALSFSGLERLVRRSLLQYAVKLPSKTDAK